MFFSNQAHLGKLKPKFSKASIHFKAKNIVLAKAVFIAIPDSKMWERQ